MIATDEEHAVVVADGIPGLLGHLKEFTDLTSDFISPDTVIAVSWENGWKPRIHMRSGGNAAQSVLFAADILDTVSVSVSRQHNGFHQFLVAGVFDGFPVEVWALSDAFEAAVINTYLDWSDMDEYGVISVTAQALRAMAEHTS